MFMHKQPKRRGGAAARQLMHVNTCAGVIRGQRADRQLFKCAVKLLVFGFFFVCFFKFDLS